MMLDLTTLTLTQLMFAALALTILDVVIAIAASIAPPNTFSLDQVATFLQTHVLWRVIPILTPAILAALQSDPNVSRAAWTVSIGGLIAYLAETVKSVQGNVAEARALSQGTADDPVLEDEPGPADHGQPDPAPTQ